MLLLIGLGLDSKDLSVKSADAAGKADIVYLEKYTTFISDEYMAYLKKEIGKSIKVLDRSDLEEDAAKTIEPAKNKDVAILVPGDPLVATTHHSTLLNLARKMNIPYSIYHASSIFTAAIGESGLDIYKFGPPVTLPFWSEKYKPTSFMNVLDKNMRNDEHSLLLLDLDQPTKRQMGLAEAVDLLKKGEEDKEFGIIDDSLKIMVLGDIGRKSELIRTTTIAEAPAIAGLFAGKTLTIIIPATPSFAEQEAISKYEASK